MAKITKFEKLAELNGRVIRIKEGSWHYYRVVSGLKQRGSGTYYEIKPQLGDVSSRRSIGSSEFDGLTVESVSQRDARDMHFLD